MMVALSRTSGDLLADRRFAYAQALASEGDAAAAADLFEQVIERVPAWTPAWIALGLAREKTGEAPAAAEAFARAEALDPTGLHGARLHAARLRHEATPAMPPAYVAALFDDYAARFDDHLVGALDYRAPALLAAALAAAMGPRRAAAALDLGCGTGLMAPPLRERADHLAGVDLSPAMVEQARGRGLYDALAVGDILDHLGGREEGSLDLAVAADVFTYLGPLGPVARATSRVLRTGGVLAFTVQQAPAGVALGADMRFSHGADHVTAALAEAGLTLLSIEEASSRRDAGAAVPGLVVIAAKP